MFIYIQQPYTRKLKRLSYQIFITNNLHKSYLHCQLARRRTQYSQLNEVLFEQMLLSGTARVRGKKAGQHACIRKIHMNLSFLTLDCVRISCVARIFEENSRLSLTHTCGVHSVASFNVNCIQISMVAAEKNAKNEATFDILVQLFFHSHVPGARELRFTVEMEVENAGARKTVVTTNK